MFLELLNIFLPAGKRRILRRKLRDAVEATLLPALQEIGFTRIAKSRVPGFGNATSYPFGVLMRERDGFVDTVQIQFEKYGNPTFHVMFGTVPPDGLPGIDGQRSQSEIVKEGGFAPNALGSRRRGIGSFTVGWIHSTEMQPALRVAGRAARMVPRIDSYLRNGTPVAGIYDGVAVYHEGLEIIRRRRAQISRRHGEV